MAALALAGLLAAALGAGVLLFDWYALAAVLGLIGFAFFVREPVIGVYITTFLLLVVGGASGMIGTFVPGMPITVTLAKISGAVTLAAWAVHSLVKREPLRLNISLALLLAFFAWTALGLAMRETWQHQLPEWLRLGNVVAFFIVSIHLLNTRARIHSYVILLCYCGLAMAAMANIQYFVPALHFGPEDFAELGERAREGAFVDPEQLDTGPAVRVTGTAGHSNWLAMGLLLILPLNLYWFRFARTNTGKALAVAATLLQLSALVFTFTRTGFIAGIAAIGLIVLTRQLKVNPYRLSALAVAALVAFFLLPPQYRERVLDPASYERSSSISHRFQLQQSAWQTFTENPVLGAGLGGFGMELVEQDYEVSLISRWFVAAQGWNPIHFGAHNMYLHLLAEAGLIGFFLLMAFLAWTITRIRLVEHRFQAAGDDQGAALCAALFVSLMTFLVCCVVLHALHQKIWWMLAAAATVVIMYGLPAPGNNGRTAEKP